MRERDIVTKQLDLSAWLSSFSSHGEGLTCEQLFCTLHVQPHTRALTASPDATQDLPPDSLLTLTASVPLALLLVVGVLPKLAKLVLPRRSIEFVRDIASSPIHFAHSHSASTHDAPSDSPSSPRDAKLSILFAIGVLEFLGWASGAVYSLVRYDISQTSAVKIFFVGLGWVRLALVLRRLDTRS